MSLIVTTPFGLTALGDIFTSKCPNGVAVCTRPIGLRTLTTNEYVERSPRLVLNSNPSAAQDRQVRIRQIYETIDRQPYQWVVVLVAGIGFFLDGYTVRRPRLSGTIRTDVA